MAVVAYNLPRTLFAAALIATIFSPVLAAERVALVVGNGAYAHTQVLNNPKNDANDIAAKLADLEFEVIKGIDVDRNEFFRKVGEFNKAASRAEVALFFYAGHGLQAGGENYLIPIEAKVEEETDLHGAIELRDVLRYMRSETNLVFLDACRDNPMVDNLTRSMEPSRSGGVARGLKRVEVEETDNSSTLISFATKWGETAEDGTGRNSPYTEALLEHIATRGITVEAMLKKVTTAVFYSTGEKQRPWVEASMAKDFYFNPKKPGEEAYEEAQRVGTAAAFQKFIEDHPESEFAIRAQNRRDALEAKEQPSELQQLLESIKVTGPRETSVALERDFWAAVKESGDPSELQAFRNAYPQSKFAFLAAHRLKKSIEDSEDTEDLQTYIESFPDGEFVANAQDRLAKLKASFADSAGLEETEFTLEIEEQTSPESPLSAPSPEMLEWSLGLERAERRRIQGGLAAEGFDPGAADGFFGPVTRSAIEGWQESHDKQITGYLNAESVKALIAAADEADARQLEAKAQAKRRAEEDSLWHSVKASKNPDDFNKYLKAYPNGRYIGQARKRKHTELLQAQAKRRAEEDSLWHSVKASKNPNDFNKYLKAYPNGRYTGQARKRHTELLQAQAKRRAEEDALWHSIRASKSPDDFNKYLKAYPNGRYTGQARKRHTELLQAQAKRRAEEDALWHSIRASKNPDDFNKYLKAYPNGRYRIQARQRRNQLIAFDDAAFKHARLENTAQSFGRYLLERPQGRHRIEARRRQQELLKAQQQEVSEDTNSRKPKSRYRDCDTCPEMVVLPSTAADSTRISVGRYEVTFAEWDECKRTGGCSHLPSDAPWGRGARPVINVSWNDAQQYVRWLSKKTGKQYRLLNESEWERASLGEKTPFIWDTFKPTSVGSSKPNANGLHDMAGNVWEWLESCAPTGSCTHRVLRGGTWGTSQWYTRSSNRNKSLPGERHKDVGFRVVSAVE